MVTAQRDRHEGTKLVLIGTSTRYHPFLSCAKSMKTENISKSPSFDLKNICNGVFLSKIIS